MRASRRRFFVGSTLGCALNALVRARAASASEESSPLSPAGEGTLRAFVDTLIPADATPSGSALGVDRQLLIVAAARPDYRRLLDLGGAWLDEQARSAGRKSFAELDEPQRDDIVGRAARAPSGTLPRVFFERTRADAFLHYYGQPESWPGLRHYRGPPQPIGFMDYAQPPDPTR